VRLKPCSMSDRARSSFGYSTKRSTRRTSESTAGASARCIAVRGRGMIWRDAEGNDLSRGGKGGLRATGTRISCRP
jgi:hypothetical protein